MAKLIISFDEIGGIGEFNGRPIHVSVPYILNKAMDYIDSDNSDHYIEELRVNWNLCDVDFVKRECILILEI